VLLEKPVATSSPEVQAIETAAIDSSAFVMPAHILRFAAPYVSLRARVAEGAIGRLLGIDSNRDRSRDHLQLYADVHPALMTLRH
jgi:predicted dehydrogenase